MNLGLRHRITFTYALLFVLILSGLGVWLSEVFSRQHESSLESGLRNDANLVAELIGQADPGSLRAIADRVSQELNVRVTIIDREGHPLAETARPVEELENHLDRPEVQTALQNETGVFRRYSATVGAELLYVAAPIRNSQGEITGVLRLSYSLAEIHAVARKVRLLIFSSLAAGLIISLILGWLVTGAATRSLAVLANKARNFGQGIFHNHKEIHSRDEIGELETVFNDMAANIISSMAMQDRERTRIEQILRSLPVGVLVVESRGILVAANSAARDILGAYPGGENRPLVHLTRNWHVNQFVNSLLAGAGPDKQEIVVSGDEGSKFILLHGALVPEQDGNAEAEVVVVLQDVTSIRLLEQQRRDLVANVSHELRTPLTAIQGFAETLREGQVDEDTSRRFLDIISQESQRLARLLNDLLNLSRLEARGRRIQGSCNLLEVTEGVTHLLGELAAARGKAMQVDVAENIRVNMDRDYVEQILMNYVDNALKYTPEGAKICIGAEVQDDNFVRLFVLDTGPGIPLQEQKRVFERFFRVDKSRGREAGGTGLGLAIVKHIVEGFGGQVGVVSHPGHGTSFWATLPLKLLD